MRDAKSYGLQRIQIVKGWLKADGASAEKVFDVACAGGKKSGATIAVPIMVRQSMSKPVKQAPKPRPVN